MNGLEELLSTAAGLESSWRQRGWRFCFIGGVAVQRWGTPRFTQDIDLTLLTGFGNEERFVDGLLQELQPRRADAREFALRHRVLLAKTANGIDVDVALGAVPFEDRSVQRASLWAVREATALTTCSAEDLVVHKVFAGRELDWGDVERVVIRQHGKLNWPQIRSELKPLLALKEASDSLDKLERIILTVERRLKTKNEY